ncbi:MAG TPA: CGNR zinc finger domain-containing protein [Trueperaceae bacterium]|nr:CGNR zinc finger domain-containing protein [Trueperaceae bacterium]
MKNAHLLRSEGRPAPGDLRFVQDLLNTLDVEKGIDGLASTSLAAGWLERFGLISRHTIVDETDVARLIEFREAVRSLLRAHAGADADEEATRVLDDLSSSVELGVSFQPTGKLTIRNRSEGIDGAFGALLVAIHEATANGTWERLKACARDTCQWVYYDASKNHSSNWCSMRTCGNREKVARHRHKAATSE